jgi:hypothetical protein
MMMNRENSFRLSSTSHTYHQNAACRQVQGIKFQIVGAAAATATAPPQRVGAHEEKTENQR